MPPSELVRELTSSATAADAPSARGPSVPGRASADLAFIRHTMERAGAFTAVPGRGGVAMGLLGFAAAPLAASRETQAGWLGVWVATAVLAVCTGAFSLHREARRVLVPLASGPGRRFVLALTPAMLAGAILTVVMAHAGMHAHLPGTWLLLYGAGVMSGGALTSVRALPLMGAGFFALGCLAYAAPASWGDGLLALGFGALHVCTGLYVARSHDG